MVQTAASQTVSRLPAFGRAGRLSAGSGACVAPRIDATMTPFLMFEGDAEAALEFYFQVFGDGRVVSLERWSDDGPDMAGKLKTATVELFGQTLIVSDSPACHGFSFTPSISFFLTLDSEDDLERLAEQLAEQGAYLMPAGDYGFSRKFAWVQDRFGVSWQLNLA